MKNTYSKLTPEEFKLEMERIEEEYKYDPEAKHSMADAIMCQLLEDLGYKDGVEVFYDMKKY